MKWISISAALLLLAAVPVQRPRVTFEAGPAVAVGDSVLEEIVFGGAGQPSQPYRCRSYRGHLNDRSAADTLLYVFLLSEESDSTRVLNLLASYQPSQWKALQAADEPNPYQDLLRWGSLLKVPVNRDGLFILVVDEYRHPGKAAFIAADTAGRVVARRRVWGE